MAVLAVAAAAFLQDDSQFSARELALSEVSGKLDFSLPEKGVSAPAGERVSSSAEENAPQVQEAESPQHKTMTVRPFSFDDSSEGHPVQFSVDAETVRSAAGGPGTAMLAPAAEKTAQEGGSAAVRREQAERAPAAAPQKDSADAARTRKPAAAEKKPAPAPRAEKPKGNAADRALADIKGQKNASQPFDRVVTSARFVMEGSLIKLVLRGNSPMVGHFSQLKDPERVVLDLAGSWNIQVPRVPSNRLIQAVRLGRHDDKTRLVFDLKTEGKAALVPLTRNSLELHIR